MSVKDINNTDKLLKTLQQLYKKDIDVGVLEESSAKMKMIATVQEYGCDIKITEKMRGYLAAVLDFRPRRSKLYINIPERSFIRAGYDENKNFIANQTEKLLVKVIEQDITPENACNVLGAVAQGKIQKFAIDLKSPPLHHVTVRAKGSDNPLVDTGELIRNIRYKVNG